MSSINKLISLWETTAKVRLTTNEYRIRLPVHDAARLAALREMYPMRSEFEIITDLLTAALDDLESRLPYQEGSRIAARDEQGDPIYEDAGPSRQFHELTKKYLSELNGAACRS